MQDRKTLLSGLLLVALFAAGCHREGAERTLTTTPQGAATAAARAVPEAAENASGVDQASAEAIVERISARVAEIRGLAFKRPVDVEVISDDRIREYLLERVEEMEMEESIRFLEATYRNLGLVPPGVDTFEILVGALEEQAGGFYDPKRDAYYLLDDMPEAMIGVITAHELVHALEDQHYDLDARTAAVMESDDRAFAVSAIHEGSATVVMTLFATEEMLAGRMDAEALAAPMPTDALDALPAVFGRQMIGPYVLGMQFLLRGNPMGIVAGFPNEDLIRAYEQGPLSSEQILHPEKYWDDAERDDPFPVSVSDRGIPHGWSRTADGELGELVLAVVIDPDAELDPQQMALGGGAAWTHPAAAGWGGDRWELFEDGERSLVRLQTVWDSLEDAKEFEAAIGKHPYLHGKRRGNRVALIAFVADASGRDLAPREMADWVKGLGAILPRNPGAS